MILSVFSFLVQLGSLAIAVPWVLLLLAAWLIMATVVVTLAYGLARL